MNINNGNSWVLANINPPELIKNAAMSTVPGFSLEIILSVVPIHKNINTITAASPKKN